MIKGFLNAIATVRTHFASIKSSGTIVKSFDRRATYIKTFIKKTRAKIFIESIGYEFKLNDTGIIDIVDKIDTRKNIVSGRIHDDIPMGDCKILGKPSNEFMQ
jgi:hypothetical protein